MLALRYGREREYKGKTDLLKGFSSVTEPVVQLVSEDEINSQGSYRMLSLFFSRKQMGRNLELNRHRS